MARTDGGKTLIVEKFDDGIKKRETWTNKFDFLLACLGFSIGLGNVWRFPYLCYKNGGGIGIAGTIIVFFLNCYYNVALTWAFYYFFSSFTTELPWAKCGHEWNKHCVDFIGYKDIDCNITLNANHSKCIINSTELHLDPVTEFWENKALGISDGIHDMGTVKWDMALCLLLAWVVVYLCICKGIKSSGKVMYVTATSPYLFMTALLIRNSMLEGAVDGVMFYLKPDLEKLTHMQVWVDAGTQIFFSFSISLGTLTALGSYNKFNHNSYRDCVLFACIDCGTSFFAGFIIFTILGNMAYEQGTTVDKVAESGPGLAFIAYPKAVSHMPAAPVWSALFFFMVILLGLDSQFVGVEGVISAVVDQWPRFLRRGHRKEIFIGCVCIVNFFIGLPMVMNGGMYVFQLFDYYAGSRIILLVAFFECVAVAWIYGSRRFYDNIEMMLGFRINPFMMVCWTVLSPVFCMTIFVLSTVNYSELDYKRPSGTYVYPAWAVAIGWSMAALCAVFIVLMIPFQICRYQLKPKTLYLLLRPQGFKEHQLRPQDIGEITLDNYHDGLDNQYLDNLHLTQHSTVYDKIPPSKRSDL